MESSFGCDLSRVRVHSDSRAAASARAVNARAYTVGQDLVFGAGQLDPGSDQGRRLLAHELTHVLQQTDGQLPLGVQRQSRGAAQEILDDPVILDAIDRLWEASFGHQPFASAELIDETLGNLQYPAEWQQYHEGRYEGVSYREACFWVDLNGQPTEIQVSNYPAEIKATIPEGGALAFVHTHPSQKRASPFATGQPDTGDVEATDVQTLRELEIPVYIVAKRTILKLHLEDDEVKRKVFNRRRLSRKRRRAE